MLECCLGGSGAGGVAHVLTLKAVHLKTRTTCTAGPAGAIGGAERDALCRHRSYLVKTSENEGDNKNREVA